MNSPDFRGLIAFVAFVCVLVGILITAIIQPTTLKSSKKILTPISYELRITDNKVDTLWVYNIAEE